MFGLLVETDWALQGVLCHDKSMKPATCDEGPQAFERFQGTMKGILAVPHTEIQRREAVYKKQATLNPHKRGPKPKKRSA
jgi:hypothetical protein